MIAVIYLSSMNNIVITQILSDKLDIPVLNKQSINENDNLLPYKKLICVKKLETKHNRDASTTVHTTLICTKEKKYDQDGNLVKFKKNYQNNNNKTRKVINSFFEENN